MKKTFRYAVFSSAGNYIDDWGDVVSDLTYSQEINSAGSQVKVILARKADDFGEGTNVDFNLKVKVYVSDDDNPNGDLIFQGFIADYAQVYGDAEHVEVTLLGYGFELDNFIIGTDQNSEVSQATGSTDQAFDNVNRIAQKFVPAQGNITSVDLKLKTSSPIDVTVSIHTDSGGSPNLNNVLGTVTQVVSDSAYAVQRFSFASPIDLTVGTTYWIVLTGGDDSEQVSTTLNCQSNEGALNSFDATYSTARAGTGTVSNQDETGGVGEQMGQAKFALYSVYEAFFKFDTSVLPLGAIITSAALKFYRTAGAGSGWTLEAWLKSWTATGNVSNPVTTTDFVPGASLSSLTKLATLGVGSTSNGAYFTMANVGTALIDNINRAGTTDVMVTSDNVRNNVAPTADESVLAAYHTTNPAKLSLVYQLTQLNAAISTSNPYASGNLATYNGSSWTQVTGSDLYFVTYTNDNATIVAYSSEDPGAIMRDIMDKYINQGGTLSYDTSTIELTGTTVSYTFNTQTVLEGIKKCLELAPVGWYFYIDQANNQVHFHEQSGSADHDLILGKDIVMINAEKRTEGIVNIIYFTGGPDGSGFNLFRQYTSESSINSYGRRLLRYVDNRVTNTDTADTIAQAILETRGAPELRIQLDVADHSGDTLKGVDIEALILGEMISFGNFSGDSSSLWDVADWDVSYWDFFIQEFGSFTLQITRVDYSPDKLTVALSTIPPDVNKRIEDINRNLTQVQTADNPSAPS